MENFRQGAGFYFPGLTAICTALSDLLGTSPTMVRWYYLTSVHPLVWDSDPISYSDSDKRMLLLGALFKALLIFSGCRHLQKNLVEHRASGIESSLLAKTISNSLEVEHVLDIRSEILSSSVYCTCISCQLVSSAINFISENRNSSKSSATKHTLLKLGVNSCCTPRLEV